MRYRVLSIVVAVVLIFAATSKMFGMTVTPIARTGILYHPALTIALIEWQLLLAASLLLVRQGQMGLVRYLAIGTFVAFSMVSARAYFAGSASCGCFGSMEVNPLYVLIFDLIVASAFVLCRPVARPDFQVQSSSLSRPIVGGLVLSLIVFGAMSAVYRSPSVALAKLRGHSIVAAPMILDLGRQPSGTEVVMSVKVTNHGIVPVRIVGGSSDCSCVTTDRLPWTLQPGEEVELPVRVKLPKAVGAFRRRAYLWTDDDRRVLSFGITGVMTE